MTYKRFIIAESKGTQWIEEMTLNGKPITNIAQAVNKLNDLSEENKELKSFKDKVFDLLDKKLEEYPYLTLTEKWDNDCKYKHSCRENHEKNVAYASVNTTLNKLKEELSHE